MQFINSSELLSSFIGFNQNVSAFFYIVQKNCQNENNFHKNKIQAICYDVASYFPSI